MSPEKETTEQILDAASEPAPAQGNVQPVADWEARYKGLQRAYDKLKADKDGLQLKYDQLVGEVEDTRQKHRTSETDRTALQSKLTQLEAEKTDLTQKLSRRDAEKERQKTIATDFPDLLAFEMQGLLPPAETPEELKTRLDAFRVALNNSVTSNVREKLQGTPPSTTPKPPTSRSKEQIYAELMQLAGRRDPDSRKKYDELYSEYMQFYKPQ